jgi:DNA-binding PadR family transcriptional regulator
MGECAITEKGESAMNDPEQKELRRDFLRAVYEQADANPAEFVHWRDLAPGYGFADTETLPKSMTGVAEQLAGLGFITIEAEEGNVYRITPAGINEVEGNTPQSEQNVSNVFNMSGTFYQAAVGTHNTNTFSGDLDFAAVERRIEEEGGADKEELHELVQEVRELLESGQMLNKGRLARFNDKLKEVPWLAGPVAGWLLNFATQEIPQHLPPHLG